MTMITKEQAQEMLNAGPNQLFQLSDYMNAVRSIIALQDLRAMVADGPPAREAVEPWIKAVMDKAASLKDETK